MLLTEEKDPMKKLIFLLLTYFLVQFTYSQNYQTIEEVDTACTQLGFMGDEEAEDAVDKILSQIGLFRNFTIQECPDINNAVAKNIDVGDGKKARYILYDNEFFEKISDKASNDWAATSILAHEIGHHLNGHSLNNEGSNLAWELEADEFSGFVLARMGSSLEDAQSAIKTLKREEATRTHPAKADRLNAIAKGWSRGSGKTITVQEVNLEEITVVEDEPIIDEEIGKVAAQKVLANCLEAIGGQENILKIKSLYQELELNSSYEMNGTPYNTTIDMKMIMITPNNFLSETQSNGTPYYSLKIDGNMYTKSKKNEDWKFLSYNNAEESQPSFIYEYSLLLNNQDVEYLGRETFKGVECHVIQLPDYNLDMNQELFQMKSNSKRIHYYNVTTGLLQFGKIITQSFIDYKENNEYLKDTNTTSEVFTTYSDYREVDGVLFAFNHEMKTTTGTTETVTVMKFQKMQANPEINPKEYKVKN